MSTYLSDTSEQVFLFGIETNDPGSLKIEESLKELALLAQTAGLSVAGQAFQRLEQVNAVTYMGQGKLAELNEELGYRNIKTLIINDELSAAQMRNLEKGLGMAVKVVDRTTLILDIFTQHAHSQEGQIQVSLAQYEYLLPRLTRMWTHLARQSGARGSGRTGGVGLRGPGETQIEADRRQIRQRIIRLKKELVKIQSQRDNRKRKRQKSGLPQIAIIGYTNAGKSSLLKQLGGQNILTADQLFSTLEPQTRRIILPGGLPVLVADTVGFIERLPHNLIAAFKATLEGINDADLLVHLIDTTSLYPQLRIKIVNQTLHELGIDNKPIITVWNKIDLVPEHAPPLEHGLAISAVTGGGVPQLIDTIAQTLLKNMVRLDLLLPYNQGSLLNQLYDTGVILDKLYDDNTIKVSAFVPVSQQGKYRPFAALKGSDTLG